MDGTETILLIVLEALIGILVTVATAIAAISHGKLNDALARLGRVESQQAMTICTLASLFPRFRDVWDATVPKNPVPSIAELRAAYGIVETKGMECSQLR